MKHPNELHQSIYPLVKVRELGEQHITGTKPHRKEQPNLSQKETSFRVFDAIIVAVFVLFFLPFCFYFCNIYVGLLESACCYNNLRN